MPRRHSHRKMKGGFWDSLTQGASDLWEKTKKATSDTYNSVTGSTSSSSSYMPSSTTPTSTSYGYMGGRRKRSRRHMRGGFHDNTPTTGLAAHAASFSGQTAQPQTIVGGRTRRRGRKGGFLGEVVNQAIVPVAILGLQQNYRRKKGGKTRRYRKH